MLRSLWSPFGSIALVLAGAVACDLPVTVADQPGPFQVAAVPLNFANSNGVYASTVRFPTSDAEAPYPAVVFAPGRRAVGEAYTDVGSHLASHGYVVLTFTPPDTLLVRHKIDGFASGLDVLVAAGADPRSPLFGLVDARRRVVMGHSQGGEAALQVAARDPSLAAVIAQAPSVGFFVRDPIDTIVAPVLLEAATEDGVVPFTVSVDAYETQLSAPKQLIVIQGGNHVGFSDVSSELGIDNPPLIPYDEQRKLSRRYATAFLEFHVKGRESFRDLIDGLTVIGDTLVGRLQDSRVELE